MAFPLQDGIVNFAPKSIGRAPIRQGAMLPRASAVSGSGDVHIEGWIAHDLQRVTGTCECSNIDDVSCAIRYSGRFHLLPYFVASS